MGLVPLHFISFCFKMASTKATQMGLSSSTITTACLYFFLTYMDDITIIGNQWDIINQFIYALTTKYTRKDKACGS